VIRTELSLRLPNNAGALAGVYRLLADEHVNVLAMSLGVCAICVFLDNVSTAPACSASAGTPSPSAVLVVEGRPPRAPFRLIADAGINLNTAMAALDRRPRRG
jgi:hypothetical protein